jgi:hypothetical protein
MIRSVNRLCLVICLILIGLFTPLIQGQNVTCPLGVFPIIRFNTVQGTAFLIDRKYGWLLSAAHVLARCDTSSPTQSVKMLVVYSSPTSMGTICFSNLISVAPIAWGYDFTQTNTQLEDTTNDWVLLSVVNPADITKFSHFDQIYVILLPTPSH